MPQISPINWVIIFFFVTTVILTTVSSFLGLNYSFKNENIVTNNQYPINW